jgi:hypothetical protein
MVVNIIYITLYNKIILMCKHIKIIVNLDDIKESKIDDRQFTSYRKNWLVLLNFLSTILTKGKT